MARKFTIFPLFYFVFEGKFQAQAPQAAYSRKGDLTEGFNFCVTILGGVYLEGLIHGGAYFRNFTVPCLGPGKMNLAGLGIIQISFKTFKLRNHQYGISALVSQTSFGGETSCSVAKCRLFSRTKNFYSASLSLVRQKPGYEITKSSAIRYNI